MSDILFRKIDLVLPNLDINEIKGPLVNSYGPLKNFDFKDQDFINDLLKPRVHFHITPREFHLTEIINGVDVHTDGAKTSFMYYIKTDGSTTWFWQADHNKSLDVLNVDGSGNRIYNESVKAWKKDDLVPLGSFKAKDGQCYLMNVEYPHSVDSPVVPTPRYILKWLWDEDFDTVLRSIELL